MNYLAILIIALVFSCGYFIIWVEEKFIDIKSVLRKNIGAHCCKRRFFNKRKQSKND